MRFKYGSIGAENDAGIPYWIFYVLPRVFPGKAAAGPGGYASLGVAWEQGQELPVGFTKKTIGFDRVANNCAVCHTTSYRASARFQPDLRPAGPNHTLDLAGLLPLSGRLRQGPALQRRHPDGRDQPGHRSGLRSTACIYRFLIIPITKKRLLEREAQFAWIYRKPISRTGGAAATTR